MSAVVVLLVRILLATALYAFLGSALWVMWKELEQASEQVTGRRISAIRLETTQGTARAGHLGICSVGSHAGPRPPIRHSLAGRGRFGTTCAA